MTIHKTINQAQRGYSLIELSLALGIIAILIAGVFQIFNSTQNSQAISTESNAIHLTMSEVSKIYRGKPKTNLTAAVAINSGIIQGFTDDGTAITNSWGRNVTLAPATINSTDDALQLTMEVDRDACASLVTATENAGMTIIVGSSTIKSNGSTIVPDKLATACRSGTAPYISVSWSRL